MEREQDRWWRLYQFIRKICPIDHNLLHTHPDSLIVGVLLWAAINERPIDWARRRENWPGLIRPKALPSQSCMSRRLRTCTVAQLLERTYTALREELPCGMVKYIDAKPLPVGGCSKDRDARYGRAASGKAKGYKLYAVVDAVTGAVDAWALGPMNYAEPTVASGLLARIPEGTLIVGDRIYDSMRLYDLAEARGQSFFARPRTGASGKSHQRHSVTRLEALKIAQSSAAAALFAGRNTIERTFAHLTSNSCGLLSLPSWVRTPHRVAAWLAAKLLTNLDRQYQIHLQRQTAA